MSLKTAFSWRGMAALALLCTAAPQQARAQQPTQAQQEEQSQQKEHVVRKGDTLWDLARFYFNDPFRWPIIFDANKNVVSNPHWIYPAEKLVIPGTPKIELLGTPVDQPRVAVVQAPPKQALSNRSRFYTPPVARDTQPTLITSEREALKLVQRTEWLSAPWIADSTALNLIGSVLKGTDPRNQGDRLAETFHPADMLYLGTVGATVAPGEQLLAIRLTRNLRGYGWVVEPQALLRIDSVAANTAKAFVVTQFGDLRIGDLTIPMPDIPQMPEDALTDVTGGPVGHIIEFLVDQPLVGTEEYAFVDLGAAQGLAIGDELQVYIPPRQPTEKQPERLPEQPVAKLRVIRVTDHVSTTRVIRLKNASLEKGLPVRVARKAP